MGYLPYQLVQDFFHQPSPNSLGPRYHRWKKSPWRWRIAQVGNTNLEIKPTSVIVSLCTESEHYIIDAAYKFPPTVCSLLCKYMPVFMHSLYCEWCSLTDCIEGKDGKNIKIQIDWLEWCCCTWKEKKKLFLKGKYGILQYCTFILPYETVIALQYFTMFYTYLHHFLNGPMEFHSNMSTWLYFTSFIFLCPKTCSHLKLPFRPPAKKIAPKIRLVDTAEHLQGCIKIPAAVNPWRGRLRCLQQNGDTILPNTFDTSCEFMFKWDFKA